MNAAEAAVASTPMSGAMALLRALRINGIDTVFALPGAQIDHLYVALHDLKSELRTLTTRHEQGAAYMAFGAARTTGRPAAFAVVPGPGLLNAAAGVLTAYGCNAPVLCLAGQIPSASIGLGTGELHEMPDQLAVARGYTKWAERVARPADAPRFVRRAFEEMLSGRAGPAHLEIALDVMGLTAPVNLGDCRAERRASPTLDSRAIERAAQLLQHARRPILFVGSGAQHASAEVRALARRLGAPVVAMRSGRGVMDEEDVLSQPFAAGHRLWARADVAVAIGSRMDFPRRVWGLDEGLKIVRIDIDPKEMTRISVPDVAVIGDAREAVAAIDATLGGAPVANEITRAELAGLKQEIIAQFDRTMAPQMAFLRALRAALPEEGFFVDELTQVGYAGWSWFPTRHPRHYVNPGYQGTLGYGVATALGVQAAHPSAPVVSISGDGGFLFCASELSTAAKYSLPVVFVVFADGHYGNVRRLQIERYGNRVHESDLHNPDFVAYARSFGIPAARCESAEALGVRLRGALAAREPTLIEVPVGHLPASHANIVLPKNRGLR